LFDNYKNPKNSTQLIIPSIHLQKLKLYTAGGGERESGAAAAEGEI